MPLRDLTENEVREIFRPVVTEMLSQQKDSSINVNLAKGDKQQLRNFLVTHTLVVLLIMGTFFFFLDRRMLAIEMQQTTVINEVNQLQHTSGNGHDTTNVAAPK